MALLEPGDGVVWTADDGSIVRGTVVSVDGGWVRVASHHPPGPHVDVAWEDLDLDNSLENAARRLRRIADSLETFAANAEAARNRAAQPGAPRRGASCLGKGTT